MECKYFSISKKLSYMKDLIFILFLLIGFPLKTWASEIDYVETNNNITLIASKTNRGGIKNLTSAYQTAYINSALLASSKKNLPLTYSLNLFTDNIIEEYAIKIYFWTSIKKPQMLKNHSKILLKLSNDSTIELTAAMSDIDYEHSFSFCYFPINKEQLVQVFNGIKKVRLEILAFNPELNNYYTEYIDYEYNKDQIGKKLRKWYDSINKEYANTKNSLLASPNPGVENIRSGF